MRFPTPLRRGTLVRRYKRFLADVRLEDGSLVTAHCPNPGSMKSCIEEGGAVWLSRSDNAKRKLPWTWEVAQVSGTYIYVNPSRANDVVAEGIKAGRVQELRDYDVLQREVTCGESRIDFLLSGGPGRCFVEVKCATMGVGEDRAAFPDSVTRRGTRHLEELFRLRQQGARAVLLFCVARDGSRSVEPAENIDPTYAATLRKVVAGGVEALGYACRVHTQGVVLERAVPVVL